MKFHPVAGNKLITSEEDWETNLPSSVSFTNMLASIQYATVV